MDFIWDGTNAAIKQNSKLLELLTIGHKKAEIKAGVQSLNDHEWTYKAACDEIQRHTKSDFTLAWHFEAVKAEAEAQLGVLARDQHW